MEMICLEYFWKVPPDTTEISTSYTVAEFQLENNMPHYKIHQIGIFSILQNQVPKQFLNWELKTWGSFFSSGNVYTIQMVYLIHAYLN